MGRGGGTSRGGVRPQPQQPHGYAGDTNIGTQSLPIPQDQIRALLQQEQRLVDHSGHQHQNEGGRGRVATPPPSHITDRPSRYRNMQSSPQDTPSGFTPDIKGIETPKSNQYIDPKRNWSYLRRKMCEKISKGKSKKGDLPFEV